MCTRLCVHVCTLYMHIYTSIYIYIYNMYIYVDIESIRQSSAEIYPMDIPMKSQVFPQQPGQLSLHARSLAKSQHTPWREPM